MRKQQAWICVSLMLAAFASNAQNAFQMRIAFPGYAGRLETLENFPARVSFTNNIGGSSFTFAQHPFAHPQGYDLRFFDANNTPLDYEIDTFDPPNAVHVWVKVPEVNPDGSTHIRAVWGVPSFGQLPCTTNGAVWADGFALVQHYAKEDGNIVTDATAANRTAKFQNAYGYADGGMVGRAAYLSTGRNSGMFMDANLEIGNAWTLSTWFKDLQRSGDWRTLARGPSGNHQIIIKDDSNALGAYIGGFVQAGGAELPPDFAGWRQITVVAAGGQTACYVDGALLGVGNYQSTESIYALGFYQGGTQKFADYLDELRVTKRARGKDWVWADFMSQGSNTVFTAYGDPEDVSPAIANLDASSVTQGSATFNGLLVMNGSQPATVSVLWGPADESARGAWPNVDTISGGPWVDGATVSFHATGLTEPEYFYTFAAQNAAGTGSASIASYFINAPLTLSAVKTEFGSGVADTTEVVVSRPLSCVAAPVVVYYSLSGDAIRDVNYAASPASGKLVIAAGETDAVITVSPLTPLNFDVAKDVVITLEPGAYIVGATDNRVELELASIESADYVWNSASGNWSDMNNWSPLGVPVNGGDTGLIASGTAIADATLGVPGNWPRIIVTDDATLNIATSPLGTPLTFDNGNLITTGNNNLSGNLTIHADGLNIGAGNYTLSGAISGSGSIVFTGNSLTLGGGYDDNAPNTFQGVTEIRSGTLYLRKNYDVPALAGDLLLNGGNINQHAIRNQINPNATITIQRGQFALSDNEWQQGTSETVSNFFILGSASSAYIGSGSHGGSSVAVQERTIVSNGTLAAWGKNAFWSTGLLEIWGRPDARSVSVGNWDGNGECGMTVGAAGLVFYQSDEGVSTLLHINAGAGNRWSRWQQNGDFIYHGNPANTNATFSSIEGVADNCVILFGGSRTFIINPGGGLVDFIFAPRLWYDWNQAITKDGDGSLVLTHPNSNNSGPIVVNAGTLLVNGALASGGAVTAYTTLGGTGRIAGHVSVIGGTLAPGAFGPGQLTLGGNLTLTGNEGMPAKLHIELAGTEAGVNHDQIVLTNPNAVVSVENTGIDVHLLDGFRPPEGTVFTIVDNQGANSVQGAFTGLDAFNNISVGDFFRFRVSITGGDGNDITLTTHYNRSLFMVR